MNHKSPDHYREELQRELSKECDRLGIDPDIHLAQQMAAMPPDGSPNLQELGHLVNRLKLKSNDSRLNASEKSRKPKFPRLC